MLQVVVLLKSVCEIQGAYLAYWLVKDVLVG